MKTMAMPYIACRAKEDIHAFCNNMSGNQDQFSKNIPTASLRNARSIVEERFRDSSKTLILT
jgi:hypothetical protein